MVGGSNRLRQGRVAQRPDQPALAGRSAGADRPGGPPKLHAKAEGPALRRPGLQTRRSDVDTSCAVAEPLRFDVQFFEHGEQQVGERGLLRIAEMSAALEA